MDILLLYHLPVMDGAIVSFLDDARPLKNIMITTHAPI